MKKSKHILKRFNRRIIVALILFLQLALVVGLGFMAEALSSRGWVFGIATLFIWVFNFVVMLNLLYQHGDPEFKIPWIVVLLSFPVMGVLLYVIFRQRSLPKKAKESLKGIREKFQPYFPKGEGRDLAKDDPYAQVMALLEASSDYKMFDGSRLTYYKTGEEFFPDLYEKLRAAKEYIFLEFFIINEGKVWNEIHEILKAKVREGVEVRLLYDDFGCYSTLPSQYFEDLRDEGIHCYAFNRASVVLTGVYNNRDHRKIAIVDDDYAYTGGLNLADEYANEIERFGYWKDTMIRVEGKAVQALTCMFLTAWDITSRTVSDYDRYLDRAFPRFENEGYVFPFGTGPENLYPIRTGEANYISMINSARRRIYISTPYFIPSNELLHAIESAALRGVEVHLILPQVPDKKIPYLIAKYHIPHVLKAGVRVYFYTPGFNHMKTVLIDDQVAFVGTINMDYRSLVHHFECGATILRSPILKDIEEDFAEMLSVSQEVPGDFSLTTPQKLACALLSVFIPLL